MMHKIFERELSKMLEVYVDDMIFKSNKKHLYEAHLIIIFNCVQKYNIRLNLYKCTFCVRTVKLFGIYLIKWGIKDKLDNVTQSLRWRYLPQTKR